jgi:phosphoribosylglycinamide formyltransferase 2
MVTLAGTQQLNEFELHARAILGLPIPNIELLKAGCSAVILSEIESGDKPTFDGIDEALKISKSDVKIFGKPSTRKYRRMGVALTYDEVNTDMIELRKKAKSIADKISVK